MKIPKNQLKNTTKNLILLSLFLLLIVLTAISWLGDLSLDAIPADSWLGRTYIDLSFGASGGFELRSGEIPAAYPVECAVWDDASLRGAQYNEVAVKSFLSDYGQTVASALAGVRRLEEGSETDFRAALSDAALYLRYDSVLPLSLLTNWMGGTLSVSDDPAVTALLLTRSGELWLRGDGAALWTGTTGQKLADVQSRAQAFSGYACRFAALSGTPYDGAAVHPETLLFDDTLSLPTLTSTAAQFATESAASLQQLLQAFGYEPHVRNYDDGDSGKRVFVESQSTLRVGEDGTVVFRANTVEGGLEAYLESELGGEQPLAFQIDYARRLLDTAAQAFSSDASFYFVYAEDDRTSGVTRLLFRYAVGGVPVMDADGVMAVIEFRDNMFVSAALNLRSFTQGEVTAGLLPSGQAASAAVGETRGLHVGYFVREDGAYAARRYYLIDGKES